MLYKREDSKLTMGKKTNKHAACQVEVVSHNLLSCRHVCDPIKFFLITQPILQDDEAAYERRRGVAKKIDDRHDGDGSI